MSTVRIPWDAHLVSIRRDVCPRARWDKVSRAWTMTAEDAERFLQAAHSRMNFMRSQCSIDIDGIGWVIGFAQGAPYRIEPALARN
jgi:hypothetical protein